MAANVYQTNIQLIGSVDPSMAAATSLTLAQLKKLQQAIQTLNTMTNKSALAMAGLPPHLAKTNVQANKLVATMQNMRASRNSSESKQSMKVAKVGVVWRPKSP